MKTFLLTILLVSCVNSFGGELSDYWFKNERDNPKKIQTKIAEMQKSRSYDAITSTNHGIIEIGIERTGCFGSCPAYTFFVKSNGEFHYHGGNYAKRSGDFTGTVPEWAFNNLAQFIRDADYMELETNYRTSITDNPTTYTMVVVNGKKKVISNYANAGPTKLWAIENLIDDLMSKAEWKAVGKPVDEKKKL